MDTPWEIEIKRAFEAIEEKYGLDGRARRFIDEAVQFHGFPAPNVILGAYMVDLAMEKMGASPGERFFAVSETAKCLPDAIAILTGCTTGSSKYLLFNSGRLSMALGRNDGSGLAKGVRIFVVHEKTAEYPALRAWYFNDKAAGAKSDIPALLDDIIRAGRSILSWETVEIPMPSKDDDWKPAICPKCGEMVPDTYMENGLCRACGMSPYFIKKQ
jgi:formylmethanofuran dehydrogenase subunit E